MATGDEVKKEKLEPQVKSVDMVRDWPTICRENLTRHKSEDMQQEAIEIGTESDDRTACQPTNRPTAQEAMEKYTIEKVTTAAPAFWETKSADAHCRTLLNISKERYAHSAPSRPVAYQLQFDAKKGATWHCIVGRNFGSFVTHGELQLACPEGYALVADAEFERDKTFHILLSRSCRNSSL